MGAHVNHPGSDRIDRPYAAPAIDLGLRSFMLRVFNTMAGGLALTGAVAYVAASSGLYALIAGTPLLWLAMLAPVRPGAAARLPCQPDEPCGGSGNFLGLRRTNGSVARGHLPGLHR